MCLSHKISEAATLAACIKGWTATALSSSEVASPEFMGVSDFPQMDLSISVLPVELMQKRECIAKRFVFDGSKITAPKAKAASTCVLSWDNFSLHK